MVAALSSSFLYLLYFRGGRLIYLFNQGESGLWIDEGDRIRNGEIMYRDFFEFVAPGLPHLNALLVIVFGPDASVFGFASVVMGSALTLAVHGLSFSPTRLSWSSLPALVFISVVYPAYNVGNHKWPSLLCVLLALLAIVRHRHPSTLDTSLAGFLLGLSTLFTQDLGAGAATGVLLSLKSRRERLPALQLVKMAGVFLVVVAVPIAYFVHRAALSTIVDQLLIFPLTQYRIANGWGIGLGYFRPEHLPRVVLQILLTTGGVAAALAGVLRRLPVAEGARLDAEAARVVSGAGLGLLAFSSFRGVFEPTGLAARCTVLLPLVCSLPALLRGRLPAFAGSAGRRLRLRRTWAACQAAVAR